MENVLGWVKEDVVTDLEKEILKDKVSVKVFLVRDLFLEDEL